jgi:hypothetical protein
MQSPIMALGMCPIGSIVTRAFGSPLTIAILNASGIRSEVLLDLQAQFRNEAFGTFDLYTGAGEDGIRHDGRS